MRRATIQFQLRSPSPLDNSRPSRKQSFTLTALLSLSLWESRALRPGEGLRGLTVVCSRLLSRRSIPTRSTTRDLPNGEVSVVSIKQRKQARDSNAVSVKHCLGASRDPDMVMSTCSCVRQNADREKPAFWRTQLRLVAEISAIILTQTNAFRTPFFERINASCQDVSRQ